MAQIGRPKKYPNGNPNKDGRITPRKLVSVLKPTHDKIDQFEEKLTKYAGMKPTRQQVLDKVAEYANQHIDKLIAENGTGRIWTTFWVAA